MSEKKIVVPEGMLEAGHSQYSAYVTSKEGVRLILEAALRWLSENPIVPSDKEFGQMCFDYLDSFHGEPPIGLTQSHYLVAEWQRRMFLAPESEDPLLSQMAEALACIVITGEPQRGSVELWSEWQLRVAAWKMCSAALATYRAQYPEKEHRNG